MISDIAWLERNEELLKEWFEFVRHKINVGSLLQLVFEKVPEHGAPRLLEVLRKGGYNSY